MPYFGSIHVSSSGFACDEETSSWAIFRLTKNIDFQHDVDGVFPSHFHLTVRDSETKDELGVEGIATKKKGGEKTMKVGKRLASKLVKRSEHETKEDAEASQEKGKENLKVDAVTQDWGHKNASTVALACNEKRISTGKLSYIWR